LGRDRATTLVAVFSARMLAACLSALTAVAFFLEWTSLERLGLDAAGTRADRADLLAELASLTVIDRPGV